MAGKAWRDACFLQSKLWTGEPRFSLVAQPAAAKDVAFSSRAQRGDASCQGAGQWSKIRTAGQSLAQNAETDRSAGDAHCICPLFPLFQRLSGNSSLSPALSMRKISHLPDRRCSIAWLRVISTAPRAHARQSAAVAWLRVTSTACRLRNGYERLALVYRPGLHSHNAALALYLARALSAVRQTQIAVAGHISQRAGKRGHLYNFSSMRSLQVHLPSGEKQPA